MESKRACTFRLSREAQELLVRYAASLGISQTAALEVLLRALRQPVPGGGAPPSHAGEDGAWAPF